MINIDSLNDINPGIGNQQFPIGQVSLLLVIGIFSSNQGAIYG